MVMLPYSIVSSLGLYQLINMFFGQFAGEPYSTGSAQAVMRAIKKSVIKEQQYIPYGTVLPLIY
jgi:hypothetical protein